MKTKRNEGRKWINFLCAVMMFAVMFIGKDVCKASTTKIPAGYTPIYTIEDLYGINNNPKGNYILMNDIDMSETAPGGEWDSGNGWKPIEHFEGILDGNGYRLSNMNIYGNVYEAGLIAECFGTVKNLGIENMHYNLEISYTNLEYIAGGISAHGGGLYDNNELPEYKNCYVTGEINIDSSSESAYVKVGGVSGYYGDVTNCYTDICVSGPSRCYGIIGSKATALGDIKDCYAVMTCENGSELFRAIGARASNSYYPSSQGAGCDDKYASATALSTAQMKMEKCYVGFDFKKIWVVDKNSSYPYPQLRNCMQVRTESIELLSGPDKTSYYTTDQLDLTGSDLKINYEDDYSVTVPLTEDMLTYKMSEGTQTVKVNYNGCTAEFDIEVEKAPETLKITAKKTKLKIGQSYTYKAKYVGEGNLTFTSSNSKILKINKKTGKAVAKKAGTVTITVKGGSLVKKIKVKVVK